MSQDTHVGLMKTTKDGRVFQSKFFSVEFTNTVLVLSFLFILWSL